MSVVKWHPVSEMMELGNLLQRSFEGNGYPPRGKGALALALALDVYETESELVLTASLPGATREDLEVEYEDRLLTVRGTVKAPELPEGAKSLLNERSFGTVSRTVRIAHHLDVANSKATFLNGLLEVRLPKAPEARKKTISIE
jgi:HSP20 family protein